MGELVLVVLAAAVVAVAGRVLRDAVTTVWSERTLSDTLACALAEIHNILDDVPVSLEQIEQVRELAGTVSEWYEARGVEPL